MDRKVDLIRKFFFESLDEKEKREFDEYVISDEKFRRMVIRGAELRGLANEILGEKIEDDPDFKRILLEEEQEEKARLKAQGAGRRAQGKEEERQGRERNRYRKLYTYFGSSVAAILIIGLVMTALLRAPKNERVFDRNFAAMEIFSFRSIQQRQPKGILLPMYQEKNYQGIRDFADIPSNLEKFSDMDYLLAGISYMEGKKFEKAEIMLSAIPVESEQYYNAAWYLGLIRLRDNQIEDCRKYLRLAQESLIFSEKAIELLDKIKDMD